MTPFMHWLGLRPGGSWGEGAYTDCGVGVATLHHWPLGGGLAWWLALDCLGLGLVWGRAYYSGDGQESRRGRGVGRMAESRCL